jgi:hypothetical protein
MDFAAMLFFDEGLFNSIFIEGIGNTRYALSNKYLFWVSSHPWYLEPV